MTDIQLDEHLLDQKLATLEGMHNWGPRVISKLETMIRTADDYALFRINPLQYAKEKGIPETEAIDLFLYATRAGLFEMEWHLVCASCCSIVSSFRALAEVHSHFVCSVCAVVNTANLDEFIQVTFTLSPSIRDNIYRHPESLSIEDFYLRYHLSKDILPFPDGTLFREMLQNITAARDYLPVGETTVFEIDAKPGIMHLSNTTDTTSVGFAVLPQQVPDVQNIEIQLMTGKFQVTNLNLGEQTIFNGHHNVRFHQFGQIAAGKVRIEITNTTPRRSTLWTLNFNEENAPRTPPLGPFLSGKQLFNTQTFLDLFRSEVVSNEEGLGVQDITVLFTDLKGSTALYEKIGDPQAFFLVRQHFDALGRVVNRHKGAIVKTIGDAVMATFLNPLDAVQAAIEMLAAIEDFNKGIAEKMVLKIGVHRGHSIVVTLNDRLDYFGQTVNIAARVQSLAEAGEVYITQDIYKSPGVQDNLGAYQVEPLETARPRPDFAHAPQC
jgi:class 3 adenylate cyclase